MKWETHSDLWPGLGVSCVVERDDVVTLSDDDGLAGSNGTTAAGEKKQNETLIFDQPKMKKWMKIKIPLVFTVSKDDCSFSSSSSSSAPYTTTGGTLVWNKHLIFFAFQVLWGVSKWTSPSSLRGFLMFSFPICPDFSVKNQDFNLNWLVYQKGCQF